MGKQPKINVIIWNKSFQPDHAYMCSRSLLPDKRWTAIKLNGKKVFYDVSTGMSLSDVPGNKIPKKCKMVSKDEANNVNDNQYSQYMYMSG